MCPKVFVCALLARGPGGEGRLCSAPASQAKKARTADSSSDGEVDYLARPRTKRPEPVPLPAAPSGPLDWLADELGALIEEEFGEDIHLFGSGDELEGEDERDADLSENEDEPAAVTEMPEPVGPTAAAAAMAAEDLGPWPLHQAMACPSTDPAVVCQRLSLENRPDWTVLGPRKEKLGKIRLIAGRTMKATCQYPGHSSNCYCVINVTTADGKWISKAVEADLLKWLALGCTTSAADHLAASHTLRVDKYGMLPGAPAVVAKPK